MLPYLVKTGVDIQKTKEEVENESRMKMNF